MISLVAVAFALITASSVPPTFEGPPGSYTYGRKFCEHSQLSIADPLPPAGLAVERASVARGEVAFARVEVRRSRGAGFGTPYEVQRFENGRWRSAPGGPGGAWHDIGLSLPEYESGYCMRYHVPDNAPLGRFRFVRELAVGSAPARPYTATFRVIP